MNELINKDAFQLVQNVWSQITETLQSNPRLRKTLLAVGAVAGFGMLNFCIDKINRRIYRYPSGPAGVYTYIPQTSHANIINPTHTNYMQVNTHPYI